MYVICKKCRSKIAVAGRPTGSTSVSNVQIRGNVHVDGGSIGFGPGGMISFGRGGAVGFGGRQESTFSCMACGTTSQYTPDEIKDDDTGADKAGGEDFGL